MKIKIIYILLYTIASLIGIIIFSMKKNNKKNFLIYWFIFSFWVYYNFSGMLRKAREENGVDH